MHVFVLSMNHLNAREIWRLFNCKFWSPDFKYISIRRDSKHRLMCVCVFVVCVCARAPRTQSKNFCYSIFEMSNSHKQHIRLYIQRNMRWIASLGVNWQHWLAFQLYHMGEWAYAHKYTIYTRRRFYVHSYALFVDGCWVIAFTFKFEWKISEVSNLLSSVAIDNGRAMWTIYGDGPMGHDLNSTFPLSFSKRSLCNEH